MPALLSVALAAHLKSVDSNAILRQASSYDNLVSDIAARTVLASWIHILGLEAYSLSGYQLSVDSKYDVDMLHAPSIDLRAISFSSSEERPRAPTITALGNSCPNKVIQKTNIRFAFR